jgi:hypothetical protein
VEFCSTSKKLGSSQKVYPAADALFLPAADALFLPAADALFLLQLMLYFFLQPHPELSTSTE